MADNDKVQFENLKTKQSAKPNPKVEDKPKAVDKPAEKTEEKVEEEKKEEKKKPVEGTTKPKEKKDYAIVRGESLKISTKYSVEIGRFIKGMKIDEAIGNLEKVTKKKLAVPMRGEMAHRKGKRLDGKGMATGKYPVTASKTFIKLLKTLKGNSIVNGLELENTKIIEVVSNKAPERRHRYGRTKFKQTHVMIKAKEMKK